MPANKTAAKILKLDKQQQYGGQVTKISEQSENIISQLREDITKICGLKEKALFDVLAEVITGLQKHLPVLKPAMKKPGKNKKRL